MTKESLIVHNPGHGVVSFKLDKAIDENIAKMSRHKQKRLVRCFSHSVVLPSRRSVDLVYLTGLTVKEIKESTEYLQMQNHFQVLHDSSLAVKEPVEEVDEETKPSSEALLAQEKAEELEALDKVEAEDLDAVLPEDELESVDELMQEEYSETVEEPEDAEPKELTTETKAQHEELAQELIDSGAEELELPGKEPVYDEPELEIKDPLGAKADKIFEDARILEAEGTTEPEPEPEPEPVKATPKARKPAKKKTAKKSAKKSAKKGKK